MHSHQLWSGAPHLGQITQQTMFGCTIYAGVTRNNFAVQEEEIVYALCDWVGWWIKNKESK